MKNIPCYALFILALLLHQGYADGERLYTEPEGYTAIYSGYLGRGNTDDEDYHDNGDSGYSAMYSGEGPYQPIPGPQFLSEAKFETAIIGESVTFHCDTENTDEYVQLWKKGEESVIFAQSTRVAADKRFQILNETSLQIEDVQPTDSGAYVCVISTDPPMELVHHLKVTSRPSSVHGCPNKSEKWVDLGGDYCYLFQTEEKVTWTEAVYHCYKEGGSLVSFHSNEELKRIVRYFKNEEGRLHIGLWKHNDGSLEWVDKSVVNYRKWGRGEPSNTEELCVEIFTESGYWNDVLCTFTLGYVCASLKGSSIQQQNKVCPDTSVHWRDLGGDQCYIVRHEESIVWQDALQRCSEEGGSLATFHSVEEVSVLLKHIGPFHGMLHIGLRQNDDGKFEWVDKSRFDLDYWDFREPNDADEECGEMLPHNGKWNDIPCGKHNGYICSVEKVDAGVRSSEIALSRNLTSTEMCGEDITSETGNIRSPNFPEKYSPNRNCLWKVTVPENFQVAINFHVVEVEYGANCVYDYIEILDGHEAESPVLRKMCGSEAPITLLSSGNKMSIKFVSDARIENIGFSADFSKQESCGGNLDSEQGILQSKNYPANYAPNENCEWKISVPESYKVLLQFQAFETEGGSDCTFDYVEIFDGHDSTSPVLERFCGSFLPGDVISSGHKMRVKFSSDDFKEYYGFLAKYTKLVVATLPVQPTTSPERDFSSSCGEDIDADTGVLISPNYPNDYGANENCIWRITVPPKYQVFLRFKTFRLEEADGCRYDSVEIFDGYDYNSPSLGKFCGRRIASNFTSSGNRMTVRFKTDSSSERSGFAAMFNKASDFDTAAETAYEGVTCGGALVSDEGTVQSPNYPENYGPNERCTWKITVPEGHQVSLKFLSFKVEMHDTCKYDYVEIRDGHLPNSDAIAKACGYDIPPEVQSSTNKLMISFKSDSSGQRNGFSAEFKKEFVAIPQRNETKRNPGTCGGEIYADSGNITSPYYPGNYSPLLNCTWKITVPEGKRLVLSFPFFQVEYSEYCEFDYMEVLDEHEPSDPVKAKFCGGRSPEFMRLSKNTVTLKFLSDDSFETSGFVVDFTSVELCDFNIVAEEGTIQSPHFPNNYEPYEKCTWKITVPENNSVTIKFLTFDVVCPDYVTAIDVGHYSYTPHFCGPEKPSSVFSTGNTTEVIFESSMHTTGRGFSAEFRKVETCGEDIVAEEGIIQSPNYPDNYPPGLNCKWTITVPDESRVLLKFLELDVNCDGDAVKVTDYNNYGAKEEKYCAFTLPSTNFYLASGNRVDIQFLSDASGVGKGFSLEFKKDICAEELFSGSGTISSESYPNNYPHMMKCSWNITVEDGYIVVLEFESFQMESCESCGCDYVEIRDGYGDDSPLLGKFCGDSIPEIIRSTSNKLFVRSGSDSSVAYQGFTANYYKEPTAESELISLLRQFPSMINQEKKTNDYRLIRSLFKK